MSVGMESSQKEDGSTRESRGRRLDRYRELIDLGSGDEERAQLSRVIVQVGIPPDLCYLRDGLARTRRILKADTDAFDELLKASGSEERVQDWVSRVDLAIALVDTMPRIPDDPIDMPMQRFSEEEGHPLNKYCMGMCPYWAVQFHELPETVAEAARIQYSELHDLVSRYLLVAQARARDDNFLERYAKWAKDGKLPKPGAQKLPAGRIEAAALALRRLSAAEYRRHVSSLAAPSDRLAERVAQAEDYAELLIDAGLNLPQDEIKGFIRMLDSFRLLDELVWQNAGYLKRRVREFSRAERTLGPDGYVRLGKRGLVLASEQLEAGGTLVRILRDPVSRAVSSESAERLDAPEVDTADQLGVLILDRAEYDQVAPGQRRLQAERQAKLLARYSSSPSLDRSSLTAWQISRIRTELKAVEPPQLRAYLVASLATGRDFAGSSLPVFEEQPRDVPAISFVNDLEPSWLLRIDPPAWAETEPVAAERTSEPVLRLPDVLGFSECLRGKPVTELSWDESIRSKALEWLQCILWDNTISLRSIHGLLARRLLEESQGDLALVRFIADARVAHAESAAHYSAVTAGAAVQLYLKALEHEREQSKTSVSAPSRVVGARRVPTLEAVKALVGSAKEKLKKAPGVDRKNALTFYTLLGFNLGVAGRAYETRRILDFVRAHGLAVLAEKGSSYNNRLVPLAPTLKRQLGAYQSALAGWGYAPTGEHGLFCHWGGDGKPKGPFSPKMFAEFAQDRGFDLELYSLRRFIRTELVQRGASPEDVDAFMGHWFNLLSPHDPFSTYPSSRLVLLAESHIEGILTDIGYTSFQ